MLLMATPAVLQLYHKGEVLACKMYSVLEMARPLTMLFSYFEGSENLSSTWLGHHFIHHRICLCEILWPFLAQLWGKISYWYSPQSKMCSYLYIKDDFKY